ncbi:MAG TPA: hypothetical protein VFT58_06545 [Nitrososphaera sp.]|nr:hypothetical protein [Nitrososphaera sp.]
MNRLPKLLFISKIAAILLGVGLSQLHIPLSKEESDAFFKACIECKSPPTYRNIDPEIVNVLLIVGIVAISAGGILTALHKNNLPATSNKLS